MPTGTLPKKNQFPGWWEPTGNDYAFRRQRRNSKLIRDHGGVIVEYRDLPKESQMALVQYMAIDGEAWDIAPSLSRLLTGAVIPTAKWNAALRKALPFYVRRYGNERYGFIAKLSMKALIESTMKDKELDQNPRNKKLWSEYHAWFMSRGRKYKTIDGNRWPVILASFDDETLEDGWNRFHQYAELDFLTIPAIWYIPSKRKVA